MDEVKVHVGDDQFEEVSREIKKAGWKVEVHKHPSNTSQVTVTKGNKQWTFKDPKQAVEFVQKSLEHHHHHH
uniref:Minimal thioredoxin fold protein, ems_thioM_802 n=1 Tax=synthetic construct TaxID=32630 RepID=UPI0020B637A9|nr:Chain A, Minimal thioredoxin fold protein, ems_thioM_802 [synthetic construct]